MSRKWNNIILKMLGGNLVVGFLSWLAKDHTFFDQGNELIYLSVYRWLNIYLQYTLTLPTHYSRADFTTLLAYCYHEVPMRFSRSKKNWQIFLSLHIIMEC